jgi:putative ABC transport system permease protein
MRRVALATLRHDALRTSLLVVGLGAAWALVSVQLGLRRGFELSSRAILDHAGGDVWVAARGVKVIDDGEPIAIDGVDHRCIHKKRPVIVDYTQARHPDGSLITVQIVGADASSRDRLPWAVVSGDRKEIDRGGIAGIDAGDASKLGLRGDGMGQKLELRSGDILEVGVVSRGARNFTQTPYLFVDLATARRLTRIPDGTATFIALDLTEPACAAEVTADLRSTELHAPAREQLSRTTTTHWIEGSGIGVLLTVGSLMAAIVGAAVLLQSTMTLVRTHTKELATVRALGARRRELAAFVAWQVGIVSLLATVIASSLATALSSVLANTGLLVVVGVESWLAGFGVALVSTIVASIAGARVLGGMDPREVLE